MRLTALGFGCRRRNFNPYLDLNQSINYFSHAAFRSIIELKGTASIFILYSANRAIGFDKVVWMLRIIYRLDTIVWMVRKYWKNEIKKFAL